MYTKYRGNQLIDSITHRGENGFIYGSNLTCGGRTWKGQTWRGAKLPVAIHNTEVLSLTYPPNVACWFLETNSNYLPSRAHQNDSLICMVESHTHDIRLFGRITILSNRELGDKHWSTSLIWFYCELLWIQRGWVVRAADLKSGYPEFKSRSDPFEVPWFNSTAGLVYSQPVCLLPLGILNLLSLFRWLKNPRV